MLLVLNCGGVLSKGVFLLKEVAYLNLSDFYNRRSPNL